MIRRISIAATAALMGCALVVAVAGPAAAKKPPPFNATGTVHCTGPGKAKLSPPLSNTPGTGTRVVTVKFNLNCTNGGSGSPTGNSGVKVNTGKLSATSSSPAANTCSSLLGTSTSSFTADIKWKTAGGKINPTHIVWSNYNGTASGFDLPGTGGTSTVTGSYAGESAVAHAAIDSNQLSQLANGCSGKGIKKITFSPSSTFSLS